MYSRMNKYDILKKYFGYDSFRPGQEELIDAALQRQDVLGIMPTGAGKSICYQVPALLLPGTTLVVSPLISLMKDQVRALNDAGIHAAYINSSLSEGQIRKAMELAAGGRYKIIYVAPERLLTPMFLGFAKRAAISMVTVDEAHCISQWGQDFRPSYRGIPAFVEELRERPVLGAFTATATQEVRTDILCMLGLHSPKVLVTGFDRENLFYEVRRGDKDAELFEYVLSHKDQSGIVYCATRKKVEEVALALQQRGVPAARYHAGLSAEERRASQDAFSCDDRPVMVATNAFGMGIDKSNVRYVIHYNMPQSVENYYQEAGRAGRDGEPADCILLYAPRDRQLCQFLLEHKTFPEGFPPEDMEAVKERDAQRLESMARYANTKSCLRAYILRYFGEKPPRRCSGCANCLGDFVEEDVTDICRSIVRCMKELPRAYGAAMIAAVLHGSRSAKVTAIHAEELPSFGTCSRISEKWLRDILLELQERGYIAASPDQYAVLRLTDQAAALSEGGSERIVMKFSRAEKEAKAAYVKRRILPGGNRTSEEEKLFEQLKALRLAIAKEEKMPAYIVFTDRTLREMSSRKPSNKAELLSISGVGEAKYEKYGERFLEVIRKAC